MPARIEKLIERINALNLRERALVMLAVLAVVVGVWQMLFFGPLEHHRAVLQQQARALHASMASLNGAITDAAQSRSEDPNAALRTRLDKVTSHNRQLDKRLESLTAGLISPSEMANVLERILKAQQGLTLLSVANLPAEPVAVSDDSGQAATIYRHGLTLTFKGSYLDTLKYLRALGRLPGRFYWDRLKLEVQDYPVSRISVTVHTLNLNEGWIGV